ncbi:transcriptional regulator family: bZIP [Purpureocillium lilacinum]|uniref:Transcriptional regulator family: bZIP n=1 Tax=Purpureocillium lilacinum TaxID=33203 RepID=A0ABR0BIQ3_PURLI|nr:transcriptional regulator family: bZIP [Purpureocillium lilacinum]
MQYKPNKPHKSHSGHDVDMTTQRDYNEDCDLLGPYMAVPLDDIIGGEDVAAAGTPSQFIMTPPVFVSDEDGIDMADVEHGGTTAPEFGDPEGKADITAPTISPLTTMATHDAPSPSATPKKTSKTSPLTSMKASDATKSSRVPYRTMSPTTEARNGSCTRNATGTNTASKQHLKAAHSRECKWNAKLERNRIAASKCRGKQKQRVHELKKAEEELEARHTRLEAEYKTLLGETVQLKNLLMGHAGCGNANIDLWVENEAVRLVQPSDLAMH